MKKIILLLFIFGSILMAKAQSLPTGDSIQISPGGIFDTIRDGLGNKYFLKDLLIPSSLTADPRGRYSVTSVTPMQCGFFNVYFDAGCGMDNPAIPAHAARRNVLCQVLTDLSNFIVPANPNNKVNMLVTNISTLTSNPGAIGVASSFYTFMNDGTTNGILDGEVWKTINSGQDSYTSTAFPVISQGQQMGTTYYHGIMAFAFSNPDINWYTDLTNSTLISPYVSGGTNDFDFYSTVLHEMTHALGFNSLMLYNGGSQWLPVGSPNPPSYTRYDMFLKTPSGQSVITNTTSCSMYNFTFNSSAVLSPNPATCGGSGNIPYNGHLNSTTCSTAIKFGGSVNHEVFTPDCFEPQTSLVHFEDQCPTSANNDLYYVMSNDAYPLALSLAGMKRYYKPEERQALCDLGYTVNCAYGNNLHPNNFYNYGCSGTCAGLGVAGVNDGITSTLAFNYNATVGSVYSIPISSVIANDFQTASIECVQLIYGSGTYTVTSTTIDCTPSAAGLIVFRYVPVGINGNRGNITYIFMNVDANNCTSSCNLVTNAGFESVTLNCKTDLANEIDCWNVNSPTPDLWGRGCTTGTNIPVGPCSPAFDTWNNGASSNNHMAGFYQSYDPQNPWGESIQNKLSSPLVNGTTYSMKFYARVNCPTTFYPGVISVCAAPATLAATPAFDPSNPNYSLLLSNIAIPHDNLWHPVNLTFTYTGTTGWNHLIIGGNAIPGTNLTSGAAYILIDDIELLPVANNVTFTPPAAVCSSTTPFTLAPFVSTTGGTFSGLGVVNTSGVYSFDPVLAGTGGHLITYTYTNPLGCTSVTSALITVNTGTALTVTASANSGICQGGAVLLTAYTASSYTWSPAATLNTSSGQIVVATPTTTTTYTVIGNNGCSSTATGTITIGLGSFTLTATASPSSICAGQSTTLTTNCTSCVQQPVWFSPLTASQGNTYVASPLVTTTYTVNVLALSHCVQTATVTVNVVPTTSLTATASDQTICTGMSTQLSAAGASTYTWTPSTGLSNVNIANPIATPTSTTTYTVNGSTSGCAATAATVAVNVATTTCSGAVSIASTTTCTTAGQSTNFGLGSTPASIAVNANVTIGDGTTVYTAALNCADIRMAPGVKIIVNANATLTVNTSWLYSCCGMWGGFDVLPGGKLVMNSCIIEDATTAVNANPVTSGTLISDLQISHCLFNKNTIGVYYQGNINNVSPAANNALRDCIFTCRSVVSTAPTTFTINSMITNFKTAFYLNNLITYPLQTTIAGIRSTYGVLLKNLTNSTAYSMGQSGSTNTTTGAGNVNIFDNLNYGIYVNSSNVSIVNNILQNCWGTNISGTPTGVGVFATVPVESRSITIGGASANEKNFFKNNLRGAQIESYQKSTITNNTFYNDFTDQWTNFTGSANTTGQYALYLKPRGVSGTVHTISITDNTMQNCVFGAYINRVSGYKTAGYTISGNTVNYNATNYFNGGIFLEDGAGNNPVSTGIIEITNNTVAGATYFGVLANYVRKNLYVHANNELSILASGPTGTPRAPIGLQHCLDSRVKVNTQLKSLGYSGVYGADVHGIFVTDSKGTSVTCNQTQDISNGITFEGDCSASTGQATDFLKNNLYNGSYGLVLQTGGKIGQQGTSTVAAGNIFGNTGIYTLSSGHTNVISTSNVNVDSKLYVVNNSCGTGLLTITKPCNNIATLLGQAFVIGTGILTSTNSGNDPNFCTSGAGVRLMEVNEVQEDSLVSISEQLEYNISDTVTQPIYDASTKWMNKQYTMEQLYRHPEWNNSPILNQFYTQNFEGTLGKLAEVNEHMTQGDYTGAWDVNAAISPTSTIEQNHKDINSFALARLLDTGYVYSDAEITALHAIAAQCHLEGGDAVMQARALYNYLTGQAELFTNDCQGAPILNEQTRATVNPSPKKIVKNVAQFSVYPNPNTGEFSVESDRAFGKGKSLQIYDINGKLVSVQNLPAENNQCHVLLSELVNGIYFYKVTSEIDGEMKNGKIIIIK